MITFNLEQPFLLKEAEEKVSLEQQKINTKFSKMLKYGLGIFVTGVIAMYFYGVVFQEMPIPKSLSLTINTVWMCLSILLIMTPLMIKPRILELISSPYKEAHLEKVHDCLAFISMPGMEKYKQYVENVRTQGRELTYFECDEIVKYWQSLAKK